MVEGVPIRLRNVAEIEKAEGPGAVNHRNITRVMDINLNVARGHDAGTIMSAIETKLLEADNAFGASRDIGDSGEVYRLAARYPLGRMA